MITLMMFQAGLGDALNHNPVAAIGLLFGAGVLTSLTPCIFPMIPITAGILAGTATGGQSRSRTVGMTLTYVGGLALFYALMGLVAGLTGSLFGTVAANPWARLTIGNFLLLFGLLMMDVLPVKVPAKLLAWVSKFGGGSYPAVFLLGATSGIVAAPCGAPAFAVVLTWVSTTESAVLGFLYLLVFSVGMTALLVLVGLSSGFLMRLPSPGNWMVTVKKLAGLMMVLMAEYYFIAAGYVW